jgi:uncharacterized phage infection (PIP) family protein YhgE
MATVEKAEVKILTAHDIGADIEDMMEQAQKAEHMHEGGKLALGDAAKKVNVLAEHLRKSIEDGDIKLEEIDSPEKIEGLVRKYIARAVNILENLQLMAQNSQIGSAGMVAGYKNAMKAPMKIMEGERKKMEALKEAIEEQQKTGDQDLDLRPVGRATGAHPGDPLADRRKSNGQTEKTEQNVPEQSKPTSPLLEQIELGLAGLDNQSEPALKLTGLRDFLLGGGDLRTKEGRELKAVAKPLLDALSVESKAKRGKNSR